MGQVKSVRLDGAFTGIHKRDFGVLTWLQSGANLWLNAVKSVDRKDQRHVAVRFGKRLCLHGAAGRTRIMPHQLQRCGMRASGEMN